MDWAKFIQDNAQSLFTLGGVFLGSLLAILGTYINNRFQFKRDERKRMWELEDRETTRRLEFRNAKLRDAQDFLNSYGRGVEDMLVAELTIIVSKDVDQLLEDLDKLLEMHKLTTNQESSIIALGDVEIAKLGTELIRIFNDELAKTQKLIEMLNDNISIDEKILFEEVNKFGEKSTIIISKIQTKLNEMAQSPP